MHVMSVEITSFGDHRNNVHHQAALEKISIWMQWVPKPFAFQHRQHEGAQVACISILIGYVSVDRGTAVPDERSN